MKKTIFSLLIIGALASATSIGVSDQSDITELSPPEIRPVCDLNQDNGITNLPAIENDTAEQGAPETAIPNSPHPTISSLSEETDANANLPPEKITAAQVSDTPAAPPPSALLPAGTQTNNIRTVDGQRQLYLPGFGWIDDHNEPGSGTTADSDGDIDKMVGEMD